MIKKLTTLVFGILIAVFGFAQEPGNSLNFDGVNDHIVVGDNDGMAAITMETWVYYPEVATEYIVCSKGVHNLELAIYPNGSLYFIPTGGVVLYASSVLSINQWTHIACVYNPSISLAKIYINGEEVYFVNHGSNPYSTPIANSTTIFTIGSRPDNTSNFKGNLDEFRIWNVARTEQEIVDNFAQPIDAGSQTGLVSYYKFNQGVAGGDNTGITGLADSTGTFNGDLTNFTLNSDSSNFVGSYAMVIPVATNPTNITTTGFTANWTAPAYGTVDNYLLYVATDPNFTNPVAGYNPLIVSGTETSSILTLELGNTYYYRVAAQNTSLTLISANSNIIELFIGTIASSTTFTYTQAGESKNCEIISDREWTSVSSETWLTLSDASGSGNHTLIITADENNTGVTRTATVTISTANQNDIIIENTQASISGAGTNENPYKIYSYADLCEIDNIDYLFSAVYELMNDIDASASLTQNGGLGFLPIGNYTIKFTGKFYGNGYTISNLYINRPTSWAVGLFGCTSNALIENINLENANITAWSLVGGIIGLAENHTTSIKSCNVSVTLNAESFVGGLFGHCTIGVCDTLVLIDSCHVNIIVGGSGVGGCGGFIGRIINDSCTCLQINNSTSKGILTEIVGGCGGLISTLETKKGLNINNCNSSVDMKPKASYENSSIGGFIGRKFGKGVLTITNSFATGDISVNSGYEIGGFCGYLYEPFLIQNCYATGNVTFNNPNQPTNKSTGGFVGKVYDNTSVVEIGNFVNCYATGNVSGLLNAGGFAGELWGDVNNCYATGKVAGNNNSNGFAGIYQRGSATNCFFNTETSGKTEFATLTVNDTITNCSGKTTNEMKQQATFNGFDFTDNWQIRENQTYPALKNVSNNAPFAIPEMIFKRGNSVLISEFFANDYDYETLQTALCYKIDSIENGTINNETITFSTDFTFNEIKLVVYRIGEIIAPGDTLWGNRADVNLTFENAIPVIAGFDNLSLFQNTPHTIILEEVNCSDADGDEINVLMIFGGDNYTYVGTTIVPALNYIGELYVTVKVFDGYEWSDEEIMTITILPTNIAPVANNSAITTRQGLAVSSTLAFSDVDGEVTNVYIETYPQHGTVNISDWEITYYPNPEYFGSDTIKWYAKDNQGAFSNIATISIEITQNTAPEITSTAPTIATVGEEYTYEVISTDAENNDLSYSLSNQPAGMIITDNVITWTPTQGTNHSGIVTLTVSDGLLNDEEDFIVFVSTVGISNLSDNGILIYPNPTTGIINFDFTDIEVQKISISDITGKIIMEKPIVNQQKNIDLSNFPKGIYLIKLQTEKEVFTTKIIKE